MNISDVSSISDNVYFVAEAASVTCLIPRSVGHLIC